MTDTAMPKYRSHKEVRALVIADLEHIEQPQSDVPKLPEVRIIFTDKAFAPKIVSAVMLHRYMPKPGDYFVVYEDGYESISPRAAFLEGYSQIINPNDQRQAVRRNQRAELLKHVDENDGGGAFARLGLMIDPLQFNDWVLREIERNGPDNYGSLVEGIAQYVGAVVFSFAFGAKDPARCAIDVMARVDESVALRLQGRGFAPGGTTLETDQSGVTHEIDAAATLASHSIVLPGNEGGMKS